MVLQAERQFREVGKQFAKVRQQVRWQARRKELEIMRDHFTEELQAVQTAAWQHSVLKVDEHG